MTSRRAERKRAERGFTLLEILVGLVIMASTVTAVMQSYSMAANAQYRAALLQRAAQIAEVRLMLLSETASSAQTTHEARTNDGYLWRETVTPLMTGAPMAGGGLVELRVTVYAPNAEPDRPTALLTTLRLSAELSDRGAP